jgi:thioredoxin:protein disulfide reductase
MGKFAIAVLILVGLGTIGVPAFAVDSADLLPPEKAYVLLAKRIVDNRAELTWRIAEGYYLYKSKFKFAAKTAGVAAGEAVFPPAQKKHDEFFGEMEIYRGEFVIALPLSREDPKLERVELLVSVQGCADLGICYPPYQQTVGLDWPAPASGAPIPLSPVASSQLKLPLKGVSSGVLQGDLLPPDQAFHFIAEVRDAETLHVAWQIADGYYLYRDRFRFALLDAEGVQLGQPELPRGLTKREDAGEVEVFYREVGFDLPLRRSNVSSRTITLQAKYQGCAEKGVCYPVMEGIAALDLPAARQSSAEPRSGISAPAQAVPQQDRIADSLRTDSIWLVAASFLGFGLLMAFSPCIFPMIPILSGIIAGQGASITTARAFLLSVIYVLAAAVTYTVFGVLAGLFGGNLQAVFQDPWVIGAFSAVFVLLALSMFGFYDMQMPAFIQERVAAISQRQRGGTLLGVAIMGALSALIVGPCMAAPLAGALIYIGQTGDAVLGGLALFAMGLGMGVPLVIIGTSAGTFLPKAGMWMIAVKAAFGVGLLAVAVGLLERVVPPAVTLFLWSLLLVIPSIYLGALDALPSEARGWRKFGKGLGVVMLIYGALLLVGVAANQPDPLQPLRGLFSQAAPKVGVESNDFIRVRSVAELEQRLAEAKAQGRRVVLDYYADWCVSCREMDRYTFGDARVRSALAETRLLRVDVTDNNTDDKALLGRYGLVGPPAILFFGPDGEERRSSRLIGDLKAEDFLAYLKRVWQ